MGAFVAATFLLAALGPGDWVTIVLFVLTLGGNAVTGYVASKVRLIDSLSSRVEQREAALASKAEQLVEAKVNARFGQLNQSIEFVGQELARINERLDRGDGKFGRLSERDGQIQVEVAVQLGEVKTWMAQTFATKDDVRELRQQMATAAGAAAGRKA